MTAIRAIAFDCFGTLVELRKPVNPYDVLAQQLGLDERRRFRRRVMTQPLSLADAAQEYSIALDSGELAVLELALEHELESIVCYPETQAVLHTLQSQGIPVALCSNLALPYAAPVTELLGESLDSCIWSFKAGAVKPDGAIYRYLCDQLGALPDQVLMVGDSATADYEGARAAGLQARHLVRNQRAGRQPHQVATLHEVLQLLQLT